MSESFIRDVLDRLLPEGAAWVPATADDYDLLLEGVADNSEAVRLDMDKLRHIRNPKLTPILSDLEKEFAVIPSATATEAERRQRLAAWMFRRNGQPTYEFLEEKLIEAGFDVHVWPNDPIVDPAIFLLQAFMMTCGDFLPSGNEAQCGEPEAFCAEVGGELLVNGEIFLQYPHFIVLCGEADAQCGEPDAQAGQFNHIILEEILYTIPTDSGYWPAIFFVGGDRDLFPIYLAGANLVIRAAVLQVNGKILIGGNFTQYNGTGRNYIARINTDGSLDATFDPGTGANSAVAEICIQTDDQILIGGYFTQYNGTGRNRIARINTDGSLDATFDPGTGANGTIMAIAIQTDGKIIIGGWFTQYNGTGRNYIARINTDGSLDATFDPGTGANSAVAEICIQTDDQILIGGNFTQYNGTGRNRIARINTDGSLDATFDPGTGANAWVHSLAIQADGKILAGGEFTSYDGVAEFRIVRINIDGTLDNTFGSVTGASGGSVHSIVIQTDDQILIGGYFTQYNGTGRNRIARINTDGSLDATFDPGTGANGQVYSVILQANEKIIIIGSFTFYNTLPRYGIACLSPTGDNDGIFNFSYSIASATVPTERRLEFRRIILKYKPMFSWAALIVTYN